MAIVFPAGTSPVLNLQWEDNNGLRTSQEHKLSPSVATVADALIAANAIRDPAQALSNARIIGANLLFPLLEDAPAALVPEAEVERVLRMTLGLGSDRRVLASVSLPSPVFSIEVEGTNVVNPANALVAAYISALFANTTDKYGSALNVVRSIKVSHRNRS